jgi:hypothetical protein
MDCSIKRADIPNLTVDLGMHVRSPSDAQVTKNVRKIAIHWAFNSITYVSINTFSIGLIRVKQL